jgi:Protein of unknown function (DUF1376)
MSDTKKPDPFVPLGTDINGYSCSLMNWDRLMASEFWATSTGDEFKAGVALWAKSYKQSPPGSLPNNDGILARFSEAGAKWPKVRAVALHGFVECSDGRLYHRVISEDVLKAAANKSARVERTTAARAAIAAKRKLSGNGLNGYHKPDEDEDLSP